MHGGRKVPYVLLRQGRVGPLLDERVDPAEGDPGPESGVIFW